MTVQSVIVPRDKFTLAEAKKWLKNHKYKYGKVHTTMNYYRFRQIEPDLSMRYYMKTLPNKIKLILTE